MGFPCSYCNTYCGDKLRLDCWGDARIKTIAGISRSRSIGLIKICNCICKQRRAHPRVSLRQLRITFIAVWFFARAVDELDLIYVTNPLQLNFELHLSLLKQRASCSTHHLDFPTSGKKFFIALKDEEDEINDMQTTLSVVTPRYQRNSFIQVPSRCHEFFETFSFNWGNLCWFIEMRLKSRATRNCSTKDDGFMSVR